MTLCVLTMSDTLLLNIHEGLKTQGKDAALVSGSYQYWHYGCDGFDDRGWGCGYRTLQTLCSWIRANQSSDVNAPTRDVPSLPEIQEALVEMEDKPSSFRGSRDWIGSVEVSLCIDNFYGVPCRIVHVAQASHLGDHLEELYQHFQSSGAPVMMGGHTDASSKGIMGACLHPPSLLVVDPHYYGNDVTKEYLQQDKWVRWVPIAEFCQESFYNICLPVVKAKS